MIRELIRSYSLPFNLFGGRWQEGLLNERRALSENMQIKSAVEKVLLAADTQSEL